MKNKTLTPESLLALDCLRHHFLGRDGVGILGTKFPCQATACLVRERNIENAPGECRFYRYLAQDKGGKWYFKDPACKSPYWNRGYSRRRKK